MHPRPAYPDLGLESDDGFLAKAAPGPWMALHLPPGSPGTASQDSLCLHPREMRPDSACLLRETPYEP